MAGKVGIQFAGDSALLKKLEAIGANVEEVCLEAIRVSAQKPKAEMLGYIRQHKLTGRTEDSFVEEYSAANGIVTANIGFNASKGGLPAIFLNVGTPTIRPSFFIDRAVEDHLDEIRRTQLEYINRLFRG